MRLRSIIFFMPILMIAKISIGQGANFNWKKIDDGNYFNKNLTVFSTDSCLYDLFKEVVNADRRHRTYAPTAYFYSLDFFIDKNMCPYLSIYPRLWSNSKHLDYTGIIRLGRMSFLCRGTFADD